MRHFVVEITYTTPLARIDEIVAEHRDYLQTGYASGMLLCSGAQVPRTGGMVIARASSREALEAFFAEDPYSRENVASYRFVEFNPVKFQPFLQPWIEAEAAS